MVSALQSLCGFATAKRDSALCSQLPFAFVLEVCLGVWDKGNPLTEVRRLK